jgi:hypothetical protein
MSSTSSVVAKTTRGNARPSTWTCCREALAGRYPRCGSTTRASGPPRMENLAPGARSSTISLRRWSQWLAERTGAGGPSMNPGHIGISLRTRTQTGRQGYYASLSAPSCPAVDDQTSGALGIACGVPVAFTGRNNRPLHQHMPGLRKLFRLAQICVLSQAAHDCAYLR